jgi:hypothetical protein
MAHRGEKIPGSLKTSLWKFNMNNDELIKHIKGIRYVVINDHYGGFGLSLAAKKEY